MLVLVLKFRPVKFHERCQIIVLLKRRHAPNEGFSEAFSWRSFFGKNEKKSNKKFKGNLPSRTPKSQKRWKKE